MGEPLAIESEENVKFGAERNGRNIGLGQEDRSCSGRVFGPSDRSIDRPFDRATKVLAIVIARSYRHCQVTVKTLKEQTLEPEIHVEIGHPIPKMQTSKLVCVYSNKALGEHDLSEFDYVLKSDEDVVYPKRFLEANTKLGFDLLGTGACLLLRKEPFVRIMKGRFVPNNFHAGLIHHIYRSENLNRSPTYPSVKPFIVRKERPNPVRSFWAGFDHYRFTPNKKKYIKWGFFGCFRGQPLLTFELSGYLYAGLKREQQFIDRSKRVPRNESEIMRKQL